MYDGKESIYQTQQQKLYFSDTRSKKHKSSQSGSFLYVSLPPCASQRRRVSWAVQCRQDQAMRSSLHYCSILRENRRSGRYSRNDAYSTQYQLPVRQGDHLSLLRERDAASSGIPLPRGNGHLHVGDAEDWTY